MSVYSFILSIHVIAGALALAAGTLALSLRKGGAGHIRAGIVFVLSMLVWRAVGVG